jgi:hypothetical protein
MSSVLWAISDPPWTLGTWWWWPGPDPSGESRLPLTMLELEVRRRVLPGRTAFLRCAGWLRSASTWTADQARRNSRARISGSPSNSGGLTFFGAFNPG